MVDIFSLERCICYPRRKLSFFMLACVPQPLMCCVRVCVYVEARNLHSRRCAEALRLSWRGKNCLACACLQFVGPLAGMAGQLCLSDNFGLNCGAESCPLFWRRLVFSAARRAASAKICVSVCRRLRRAVEKKKKKYFATFRRHHHRNDLLHSVSAESCSTWRAREKKETMVLCLIVDKNCNAVV